MLHILRRFWYRRRGSSSSSSSRGRRLPCGVLLLSLNSPVLLRRRCGSKSNSGLASTSVQQQGDVVGRVLEVGDDNPTTVDGGLETHFPAGLRLRLRVKIRAKGQQALQLDGIHALKLKVSRVCAALYASDSQVGRI